MLAIGAACSARSTAAAHHGFIGPSDTRVLDLGPRTGSGGTYMRHTRSSYVRQGHRDLRKRLVPSAIDSYAARRRVGGGTAHTPAAPTQARSTAADLGGDLSPLRPCGGSAPGGVGQVAGSPHRLLVVFSEPLASPARPNVHRPSAQHTVHMSVARRAPAAGPRHLGPSASGAARRAD